MPSGHVDYSTISITEKKFACTHTRPKAKFFVTLNCVLTYGSLVREQHNKKTDPKFL
jgi:hypothetical protein